jgi:hypothetical protein
MIGLLCLFLALVAAPFKSKSRLEAENTALRNQLIVLRRQVRGLVQNLKTLANHIWRSPPDATVACAT